MLKYVSSKRVICVAAITNHYMYYIIKYIIMHYMYNNIFHTSCLLQLSIYHYWNVRYTNFDMQYEYYQVIAVMIKNKTFLIIDIQYIIKCECKIAKIKFTRIYFIFSLLFQLCKGLFSYKTDFESVPKWVLWVTSNK